MYIHSDFMTATEVAVYLRVSRVTVYRMIRRGQLPEPVRFSARCSRWRRCDVEAALWEVAQSAGGQS